MTHGQTMLTIRPDDDGDQEELRRGAAHEDDQQEVRRERPETAPMIRCISTSDSRFEHSPAPGGPRPEPTVAGGP